MISSKAISVLKKVYHHANADYDNDYFGRVGRKTDFLTEEQVLLLEKANLVPNDFKEMTHDTLLEGFLQIRESGALSLEFCTSLFLKGLSGDFPRYRQTLMSYWYLRGLADHTFEESDARAGCAICELPEHVVKDRTDNLLTYHLGGSWNEMPEDFLDELQEISQIEQPEVSDDDVERFVRLLNEIDNAEADETPGQLEKRIGKSKILPKTDKYKRYGILQTLAVVGVLPSSPALDKQPVRSDIVFPLAGWKGELGVDFDRASEIFNIELDGKRSA